MLIIIEGIVVCFILLLVCVVGLKDGPEKFAVFYEVILNNELKLVEYIL